MNGGPRNAKGFTIREQLLIADFLKTRGANATESAKRAGYNGNRNTLGVIAFETLRRPKIAKEINRRMSTKLSTDEVEAEIAEVALSTVPINGSDKMKALDLLTKIKGMVTSKVETSNTNYSAIDPSQLIRSIARISAKTGQNQRFIAEIMAQDFSDQSDPDYNPDLHAAIDQIVANMPVSEQISEVQEIGDQ